MAIERLTAGLGYERRGRASVVHAAEEPILRLRRDRTRARVDLLLLGGERTVEVSFHPATADAVVRARARLTDADPNGWAGALASAIREDAGRWGLARGDGELLRVLGAVAHPVLAEAYAGGAATVEEVPRWAAPALGAASVAEAAGLLFGARAARRPVVRATATALTALPGSWWSLASAVAAAPVVEPDDLVRILGGPPAAGAEVPTGEEVRDLADGLRLVGRDRARRLALEAAGSATGPALLVTLRLLLEVERDVRRPLPATRAELERVCLLAAPIDPDPYRPRGLPPHPVRPAEPAPRAHGGPDPSGAGPTAAEPATRELELQAAVTAAFPGTQAVRERPAAPAETPRPVRPRRPGFAVARVAPQVRRAAPPADREFRHGGFARALAASGVGGRYDLVLPRSGEELATWGRLLGNCLADFAAAVASGATVVLGVRDQGLLVAAAEVRCRQLVQLLGARNRPVPRRLSDAVVAHLDAVLRIRLRP